MKKKDFQFQTGKIIIYSNGILFLSIIVLFLFGGFLPEELAEIMKFLVPIQAVYMTAIVKFMIANKYEKKDGVEDMIFNHFYVKTTRLIVVTHLVILLIGIILKGLGFLEMAMLTNLVAIIETFFGVYIGSIILDLYKPEEPQE